MLLDLPRAFNQVGMLDIQTMVNNAVDAGRQKELADSPQLLLGELILKLESVSPDKPLYIDIEDKRPMGIDSWRGIYAELAIQTESMGSVQTKEVDEAIGGEIYYKHENIGKENPTVSEWIEVMKEAIGRTFTGYKGGNFTMSKNTPVWLAEYSESGFGKDYKSTFFVDVEEKDGRVYLITGTK